ncbi:hypothetical protein FKW77_005927 [Venturia effusa]|uniref:Uncharacterized protein n=1 Tax=Venturia effusa TaxID=50376 RepID=A0A517L7G0_9PEZI|nr:hypothetical protein FKW77_005927 [Venturia effusa]
MNPGRKINSPKSRRPGGQASNVSLRANQAFSQPQAPANFGTREEDQFKVPKTPSPASPHSPIPAWRTQSQKLLDTEEDIPSNNPFIEDSYTSPSETPNPFADLSHGYHPPGQFFIRKMKHNVDPSERVPDESLLVLPTYTTSPSSQEPNSFGALSFHTPESQLAFQRASEASELGIK